MTIKKTIFCGILASGLFSHSMLAVSNPREVICKGTLGKLDVERVRVPRGHTCHLRGTSVRRGIIVEPNATLRLSGSNINGNIRIYQQHQLKLDRKTRVRGQILKLQR